MKKLFDYLLKYKMGFLSEKDRVIFEKELKKDLFLQEALEGLTVFLNNNDPIELNHFFDDSKNALDHQFRS